MKSSKNFQKSKKTKHFDGEGELKAKKGGSSKKSKYFKKEIEDELDDSEEFDLFKFSEDEEDLEED